MGNRVIDKSVTTMNWTNQGDCGDDISQFGNGNIKNRVGYFSTSRATGTEINRSDGHENINRVSEGITVGQFFMSSRTDPEEGVKTQNTIADWNKQDDDGINIDCEKYGISGTDRNRFPEVNHHDLSGGRSGTSATAVERISQISSNLSNEINLNENIALHETKITCSLMNDNYASELVEWACTSNGNTGNGTININMKSVNAYNVSKCNERSAATI